MLFFTMPHLTVMINMRLALLSVEKCTHNGNRVMLFCAPNTMIGIGVYQSTATILTNASAPVMLEPLISLDLTKVIRITGLRDSYRERGR